MRIESSHISDWEKEFSRFTKYIRFYFRIQHDNRNEYVLYIDKKTLNPKKVHRTLYGNETVYCTRCDKEHGEFCPTLNELEVLEQLMNEFFDKMKENSYLISG